MNRSLETLFYHQDDVDLLHEVLFEATGRGLNNRQLMLLFGQLPEEIQEMAGLWGLADETFLAAVDELFRPPSCRHDPGRKTR